MWVTLKLENHGKRRKGNRERERRRKEEECKISNS